MRNKAIGGGCLVLFLLVFSFFILFSGGQAFLEVPIYLLIGWLPFSSRVLPNVRPNAEALISAVVVALALCTGLHWVLAAWHRQKHPEEPTDKPFPIKTTASVFALVIAALTISMASIGVLHQVGWMFGKDKVVETERDVYGGLGRADAVVANQCYLFGHSRGSMTSRARVFTSSRDTHEVFADDAVDYVLIFARNGENGQPPSPFSCEADGRIKYREMSIDEAVAAFFADAKTANDAGIPDATETPDAH